MSSEITVTAALTYKDATGTAEQLSLDAGVFTPSTLKVSKTKQIINTTETALKLGDTTAPGYVLLKNLDPTNSVDVKVAASGAIFARLDPDTGSAGKGGACLLKLGSGAQAPVAIANTAACLIAVMVVAA